MSVFDLETGGHLDLVQKEFERGEIEAAGHRMGFPAEKVFINISEIGNTTAAAAVCCALLGVSATQMAGPGTGLDAAGVSHKAVIIERALAHHADHLDTPLDVLQRLGGFARFVVFLVVLLSVLLVVLNLIISCR